MALTGSDFQNFGGISTNLEVGVEKAVGTITINGTTYTRYVKIVDCGALPSNTSKNVPHGITGVLGWLSLSGVTYYDDNSNCMSVPLLWGNYGIGVAVTSDNVVINCTNSTWGNSYKNTRIAIEYYR